MTTSEPDPRTDLAGWLGLKPAQVSWCRSEAEAGDGTVAAAVGRRIIEQDQADTPDPEPDHGHTDCLVAHTAAAQLRKLDRIEAALGDVWTANEIRWAVGDGRVVKMAYHPLDEMLRRLADALEDPGTDG